MNTRNAPKEVFLQVLSMTTLYLTVINVLQILWQALNKWLPDALEMEYGYSAFSNGVIQFALASFIVSFPVFLVTTLALKKMYGENQESATSKLRRYLTYITLFIGSLVMIGDVIAIVTTYLSGELTVRFLLKALSIVVVVGGAWMYYYTEIKKVEMGGDLSINKPLAYSVSVIALAILVLGVVVNGSPTSARAARFDQMRLNDLQQMQYSVVNYFQMKQALPNTLSELNGTFVDPETKQATYEYRKIDATKFELCAVFGSSTETSTTPKQAMFGVEGIKNGSDWEHAKGRDCFEREIDPDFFKPVPGVPTVK